MNRLKSWVMPFYPGSNSSQKEKKQQSHYSSHDDDGEAEGSKWTRGNKRNDQNRAMTVESGNQRGDEPQSSPVDAKKSKETHGFKWSRSNCGKNHDERHYVETFGNQEGSDEHQSSSVYANKSIENLTTELSHVTFLDSPEILLHKLKKRLEIQDELITKLQTERRHYKITGFPQTGSDTLTNCIEPKKLLYKETQTYHPALVNKQTQTDEEGSYVLVTELEQHNLQLHEENFHLTEEVKELKQEILVLKRPAAIVIRKVCVDLYSPGGSAIIEGIEDSFKKELQSKLHSKHIELTYNLIHGHEQKQLKEPSIVLCPNFSRLGTDVKSIFSAIQDCGRGTVLVVIHYKDEHRLSKVKSEQMLSSEYSHLSSILDMAYFVKKGFYDCQFNQNTLEELSTFLNNFAV